jgi:hypothetical protein
MHPSRLVSHQTAGAKPIRGVGLGGARVMIIDYFFFAPANYPNANLNPNPSPCLWLSAGGLVRDNLAPSLWLVSLLRVTEKNKKLPLCGAAGAPPGSAATAASQSPPPPPPTPISSTRQPTAFNLKNSIPKHQNHILKSKHKSNIVKAKYRATL